MKKVKFTQMKDGDKKDYMLLSKNQDSFFKEAPNRIISLLEKLDSSYGGYKVSRL